MEKLYTETRGSGSPPFVLVHGWTCDHGTMLPLADAFSDHECHLVDLLGHGRSPKAASYAIEDQADAVLAVAPDRAIWIGHSMGGQVALAAAAAAPKKVAGVVLLDPAQVAPYEKAVAFMEGVRTQLARFDIPDMMEAFARNQIVRATDPAVVERTVATMRSTHPAVTRAAWDAIMAWDGRSALERVRCPILLVTIDKPLNRPIDIVRINSRVMTGQVAGSGHMLQFEVMDQITPMIRRFLEINDLVSDG
jgi:pimeloyl-ACP methyl ester carboxylesterase